MKLLIKVCQYLIIVIVLFLTAFNIYKYFLQQTREIETLKKVVSRLSAETRVAEVLVTAVSYDEKSKKKFTTIKFLEYNTNNEPLPARYFTFSGNIIQFQSLVIRFDDIRIRNGDKLKGKSVYLFWKVFMLDGQNTQEYEITKINEIPQGYKLKEGDLPTENKLWKKFWLYAQNPDAAGLLGIKNAQIEAPGTMFIPGNLYVIKIEHDGGLRIDAKPIPQILKGETILK